jgi:Cellulose binding domain
LDACVNLPESPYDEVEAEHDEPVDPAPETTGRTGEAEPARTSGRTGRTGDAEPPRTSGRPVGRAAVGELVTRVELDDAKPGPTGWRKRATVGLVLVALAVGLPVVLAATRPTGPVALPLPPGLATPITGGPSPFVPPSPEATGADPPSPGGAPPGGGSGTAAPGTSATTTGAGTPTPAPGTSAAQPVPAPVPKPLTAGYETVARTGLLGLAGYQGRVTIRNPGQVIVSGWTVTISLPAGETVNGATGAAYRQQGTIVTFRPSGGTGTVPAGGSVRFTFSVGGLLAGDPTGCAIDGRPCG